MKGNREFHARRAKARAAFNAKATRAANARRAALTELVGNARLAGRVMTQVELARALGVSQTTICHDLRALRSGLPRCPHCGR